MSGAPPPLLDVTELRVELAAEGGALLAVDDVSFTMAPGEVLGLVGESGAGKSLIAAAIIGLLDPPARLVAGTIRLDGRRIDDLPPGALRRIRGRHIGSIFQDPLTSLDPLQRVDDQIAETIRAHLPLSAAAARARAVGWLREVGIPSPEERARAYPHQLSGGMRQRVVIALALCAEPRLVIADECTTALDVSTQAQILALLDRLRRERGMAVLLVSHDLGVVAELADRVAVLYAGRLAEIGPCRDVLGAPAHPYTRGLLDAVLPLTGHVDRLPQIDGAMPRPGETPAGCAFHPRCPTSMDRCRQERPVLLPAGTARAACWLQDDVAAGSWHA